MDLPKGYTVYLEQYLTAKKSKQVSQLMICEHCAFPFGLLLATRLRVGSSASRQRTLMLIYFCKLDAVILKNRSTKDNLGFVFPSACSEVERTVGCF